MATDSINILPKGKDKYNLYHITCQIIYDMPFAGEGKSTLIMKEGNVV